YRTTHFTNRLFPVSTGCQGFPDSEWRKSPTIIAQPRSYDYWSRGGAGRRAALTQPSTTRAFSPGMRSHGDIPTVLVVHILGYNPFARSACIILSSHDMESRTCSS